MNYYYSLDIPCMLGMNRQGGPNNGNGMMQPQNFGGAMQPQNMGGMMQPTGKLPMMPQTMGGTSTDITTPTLPTGLPSGPSSGAIPGFPMGPAAGVQPTAEIQPAPQTVQSTEFVAGYLRTQIGRNCRVEFLIGTNGPLVDRIGTLVGVGASYILLKPVESDDILLCDLYSIKFVTFYY